MNRIKYGILIGCFAVILSHPHDALLAQVPAELSAMDISAYAEKSYGPFHGLISGEKYYYPYRMASGDPFLHGDNFQPATVRVQGKPYENQRIKFDIYMQLVLLEYCEKSGASISIILADEFLDQFEIDGVLFKKLQNEEGAKQFAQQVYEGNISCYYLWSKKYAVATNVGEHHYSFSDPLRKSYLLINGKVYPYAGKRSFLKVFRGEHLVQIRAYMKKHGIRFRKINDREMATLMKFINQLYENEY